jgi:hypothetical protein
MSSSDVEGPVWSKGEGGRRKTGDRREEGGGGGKRISDTNDQPDNQDYGGRQPFRARQGYNYGVLDAGVK